MPVHRTIHCRSLRQCKLTTLLALLLAGTLATLATGEGQPAGDESARLENRFNDPFFQFTSAVADCPVPLGPRINLAAQIAQTPQREQRGAHCMTEKPCLRPNAFAYDADIASALQQALKPAQLYTHSPLVNSSLWATVQGRTVTVEGCVAGDVPTGFDHDFRARQIDVLARSLPNVQKIVVRIRTGAQARAGVAVPYPTHAP